MKRSYKNRRATDSIPAGTFYVVCVFTLLSALRAAPPAAAQSTQARSDELDEVVVTAERRETTEQKTPISMTVITGAALEEQGITDIDRLIEQVPNVSFNSMGPGRTTLDMRGMSSMGGTSPTVGLYLEDIPLPTNTSEYAAAGKSGLDPNLYDLQRVEVLRGPQGTLFGASSMGGTIRLIPNPPVLNSFGASVDVTGSSTQGSDAANYNLEGMLNLPLITDKLALRIVATDKYDAGFIDRIVLSNFPLPNANGTRGNVAAAAVAAVHKDDNTDRIKVVRVALEFKPIDSLTITPAVFSQRLYLCCTLDSYDIWAANPGGNLTHYQPVDSPERSDQTMNIYSLGIKYEAGGVKLESVTSSTYSNSSAQEDEAEILEAGFGPPPGENFPVNSQIQENHHITQITQELRLSSNYDSPLQWLGGVFYSKFTDYRIDVNAAPDYATVIGTPLIIQDIENDKVTQKAAFGEVNYQFMPQWTVTAGLRYYDYTNSFTDNQSGFYETPQSADTAGTAGNSGVLPKLTLTYTPEDNLLLYATASKGFRPGGPNIPIPVGNVPFSCSPSLAQAGFSAFPFSFSPDTVWNYELGEKFRTEDGKFSAEAAIFYLRWNDIQQQVNLSCGFYFSANAGTAVSKGGELELRGKLTPELELQASGGYTDAHLTALSVAADPGAGLITGQQLPDIPVWTYSATLSHTLPLPDDYSLNTQVAERYVGGEFDYFGTPYPYTYKPGYHVLDFRIGVTHKNWSVQAFVDNALNSDGVLGVEREVSNNVTEFARLVPLRPRTIGLKLHYAY